MSSSEQGIRFFTTALYPCSYLPGQQARSLVAAIDSHLSSPFASALVTQGFRRSGSCFYRPHCPACNACIPLRIPVAGFRPNRSQRRTQKANRDLDLAIVEARFNLEHFKLYRRYQRSRHAGGGMDDDDPDAYRRFLLATPENTILVEFRQQGILRMVAVVDLLRDGLSAVYTYYDPDQTERGYGVYGILSQIETCRRLGLPYLYLGYWIEECRKMSYKTSYRPVELYIDGRWRPHEPETFPKGD